MEVMASRRIRHWMLLAAATIGAIAIAVVVVRSGTTRESPEPDTIVTRLAQRVSPPATPVRAAGDWSAFAVRNGFEAPGDYRAVINRYGAGSFGEAIRLLEPFHPTETLVAASDWDRQNLEGLRRRFPHQYPNWPMWPEEGGFLPWASAADGDLVGWRTQGPPGEWTTVYWGEVDVREYDMGAGAFLLAVAAGSLSDDALPEAQEMTPFLAAPADPPASRPVRSQAEVRLGPVASPRPDFNETVVGMLGDGRVPGVALVAYGAQGERPGELHHLVTVTFPRDGEERAKDAIRALARRLRLPIFDAHDLRYRLIWPDL